MSAWRVDRSRFWAVVLSSTRISEVCQEKAGHTELDFLLLGIRRPLLLVFFYWYWTEDASRYFRESISVRCGCHPYKWRLHARETPGFDREQKGRLNLYRCLIVWYFYEKLSKLRSPPLFQVFQTNHGKAKTRAHQWEPGSAEDPHPGRTQERRKETHRLIIQLDVNICELKKQI